MRSSLLDSDTRLYNELLSRGVSKRRATELQNLMIHCAYNNYAINTPNGDLCIATSDCQPELLLALAAETTHKGTTLCIMSPYNGRERQECCHAIIASHASTSVDKRAYVLLFNNHLPKQHFRI